MAGRDAAFCVTVERQPQGRLSGVTDLNHSVRPLFHKHLIKQGFQKPEMVVQISEAWVSKNLKSREVNGFKPSEDPNRTEAILIALHTPDRSLIGMCPIVNEPTRHAEYGELELDARNFGRMSLTTESVLQ